MTPMLSSLSPLFVGPLGILVFALLLIIGILVIARLVFTLAWKFVLIGALVLGFLWLVGTLSVGSPGRAPIGAILPI